MTKPADTAEKTSADASASANDAAANKVTAPNLPAGSTEETPKATDTGAKPTMAGDEQSAVKQTTHVIARGDTYWDLAAKFYGSGTEWRKIANANKEMRPRALHIGSELVVPAK
jgi:5'-nucleotidase